MEELLKQIMNDSYFGFSAWIIGAIASLIGIYAFFFQKNQVIIQEKEINIRHDARGICADCDSTIPSSSVTCNKCGSAEPFNPTILIEKAIQKLNSNFLLFNWYVESTNHKILEYMKVYVYSFIPALIALVVLAYIGKQWDNSIFNFIIGILGLFVLGYFYGMPHMLIKEYNPYDFEFSKLSEKELDELDKRINYTINSSKDKKELKKLSIEIDKSLKNIQSFSNIEMTKEILFWLYIVFVYILIYGSLTLVEEAFSTLSIYSKGEDYFMFIISLGLLYSISLAFIRFIWINFLYFTTVNFSGKRHLQKYKNILKNKEIF